MGANAPASQPAGSAYGAPSAPAGSYGPGQHPADGAVGLAAPGYPAAPPSQQAATPPSNWGQGPASGQQAPTSNKFPVVAIVAVAVVVALVAVGVGAKVLGSGGSTSGGLTGPRGELLESSSGPTKVPKEAWTKRLGCDGDESACSVKADDSRVFATVADDYSSRAEVTAYAGGDGKELWSATVGSAATMALQGGTLLVSSSPSGDGDSEVKAFDPASGKVRWTADGSLAGQNGFAGAADTVFLNSSNDGEDVGDTTAVALKDGKERWTERGAMLGACSDHALLYDGGDLVLVGLGDGKRVGSVPFVESEEETAANAACAHGTLAVLRKGRITAYKDGDAKQIWDRSVDDDRSDRGIVVTSDSVVAIGGEGSVALKRGNGEEGWRDETQIRGDAYPFSFDAPKGIMVAAQDDEATLRSHKDGSTLGSTGLSDVSDIGLSADQLMARSTDEVTAYDLGDLHERWSLSTNDSQDVGVGGGRLYVLTSGGDLVAYK